MKHIIWAFRSILYSESNTITEQITKIAFVLSTPHNLFKIIIVVVIRGKYH